MSVWLLLTPLLPLTLASLLFVAREHARFCAWGVRLAPLALLPALIAGLLPAGTSLELEAVLLGMRLGLDATGRVFLLFSVLIWLFATVYAQTWLAGDARRTRFFGFLLAAAAGNLGLCWRRTC
jgi:formate hydrogenlyase subunit 3/multisubunit Na+/H+ antiporter MnhD subunit